MKPDQKRLMELNPMHSRRRYACKEIRLQLHTWNRTCGQPLLLLCIHVITSHVCSPCLGATCVESNLLPTTCVDPGQPNGVGSGCIPTFSPENHNDLHCQGMDDCLKYCFPARKIRKRFVNKGCVAQLSLTLLLITRRYRSALPSDCHVDYMM